jgi:hypothetical protein
MISRVNSFSRHFDRIPSATRPIYIEYGRRYTIPSQALPIKIFGCEFGFARISLSQIWVLIPATTFSMTSWLS